MEALHQARERIYFLSSLTFYIYYKAILKLFQISICGNADECADAARRMRAENLTKFFKFRTNVRSWKFDFKSQILGGSPQLLVAAPFRRTGAAASRGRAAAPTQLPNAAPPRPPSVVLDCGTAAVNGRPRRTFVRIVCEITNES